MSVVVCDLDGVVWRGDAPIPGSADAIERLRAAGYDVGFLTNNSSATVETYVAKLARHRVTARPQEIVTSAVVAGELLARRHPGGGRVMACAGPGVVEALERNGFDLVDAGPAIAVVVGWHEDFDFAELSAAVRAIRDGAELVATNLDPTFPGADGVLPGNGALVAAVRTAAGVAPIVAGKPEAPTADAVRRRFGTAGLLVGDRPSTDGAMAATLGWPFALVLSGVSGPGGEEPIPDPAPAYVAADLAAFADMLLGRS